MTDAVLTDEERDALRAFGKAVVAGRKSKDEAARLKREVAAIQKLVKACSGKAVPDSEAANIIAWW